MQKLINLVQQHSIFCLLQPKEVAEIDELKFDPI